MAKGKNERNTENIVRNELRAHGYYEENSHLGIEEQTSKNETVTRLLKNGSKSRKGGVGRPEFIVTSFVNPDFIAVFECKASEKDHKSNQVDEILCGRPISEDSEEEAKRIQKYAVDGALHYASLLSKEFNVIAVAVSGERKTSALTNVYLHSKGASKPKLLVSKANDEPISQILPWNDLIEHAIFDPFVRAARLSDLLDFARDLHVFMRDHAKLTESEKPLLVSGTLIALRNKAFAKSYDLHSATSLSKEWIKVIKNEIDDAQIPQAKKENMAQPYASISVHPELSKATDAYKKGVMHELIRRINEKAAPFINANDGLDILGQFYGEFLKYTGGDKKALGIVLTPRHITELFALMANVNKDSTVVDICAGTGGFLIAAMSQMMRGSNTEDERNRIKSDGLIGVEQQPNMYALAASNMILRGDGKANLYQGSCFDTAIAKDIKTKLPNVGFLNPPFSQGDSDLHELRFIQHMLSLLVVGGTGIAIVPMSCAISPHKLRAELLREHTLEAVMSMPPDLFSPVGVVCCIMVFTAGVPHSTSSKKTWFGYWKDDGFIKTKHKGRVDQKGGWMTLRDKWVSMFRNREVIKGESISKIVGPDDEWCAEAYMETDYTKIDQQLFEQTVRNYAVFQLLGRQAKEPK